MPSITIRAQFSETKKVAQLFKLQREYFNGEDVIQADQTGYFLELDDSRSDYLLDVLDCAPDMMRFEPFVEWDVRHKDQMPLRFGALSDEAFDAMVA